MNLMRISTLATPLRLLALLLLLPLAACQDISADLAPSGDDNRPAASGGTIGHLPGELAADFTLTNTLGVDVHLADQLQGGATPADAVVLYFTMWCPICLSHSDHLLNVVVPQFAARGTVRYYLVDYVSGSVETSRSSELANGYGGSALVTLVDANQRVYDQLHAVMGTVVVIDATGTILLNEDYRDGSPLVGTLDTLLPQ